MLRVTDAELRRILKNTAPASGEGEAKPAKAKAKKGQPQERQERDELQDKFAATWAQLGGPSLTAEYRFHGSRRYRLDFALPDVKIGIEVDGGTWSKGRTGHNWGPGITRDHEKQNLAVMSGWRIFRFTSDMLSNKKIVGNLEPVIRFAIDETQRR